jgi:UDP-2,4-diacetamido-2,4,6-trideoxy-beta-L-altropyranose hydrolase
MRAKCIFFRGDGNNSLGHGHISRLMAICERLKNLSDTKFIVINSDLSVIEKLKKRGFVYVKFFSEDQFIDSIHKGDIVILDGYDFTEEYIESIRLKFAKIVFIDDLNNKPLYVDMIINHSNYFKALDYNCNNDTHLFIGDNYSMIGSSFLDQRKPKQIKKLKNIGICLGMSNSGKLLNNIIEKALHVFGDSNIEVISGGNKIKIHSNEKRIIVHNFLDEKGMISFFDNVDLAILPVSTVYMEAYARNTIVIGGYFTSDQKNIYDSVVTKENIFGAGDLNLLNIDKLRKIREIIEQQLPIKVENEIGHGWNYIKEIIGSWINKE